MAKSSEFSVKHGEKGSAHTGVRGRNTSPGSYREEVMYPDEYGMDMSADDLHYSFELPSYPLEIVDYLGHYFLPAEKAA
jgi:hypothetical protein